MPALLEVQAAFCRAIAGDDAALLADAVRGDGLDPAQRVQIYRNNTLLTLTAALATTYPATCRLVGRGFFDFAAAGYIAHRLPDRPCLFEYGGGFGDFLAGFAPASRLAWLPDVARLEWAVNATWNAPAVAPLTFDAIAAAAQAAGAGLRLGLDPALRYLASAWAVDAIWRANRTHAEADVTESVATPVWLEIRRHAEGVVVRRLDPACWSLRARLGGGETIGAAAAAVLADAPAFDLAGALRVMAAEGLFVAVIPQPVAEEAAA
jgi:hypothetical protein